MFNVTNIHQFLDFADQVSKGTFVGTASLLADISFDEWVVIPPVGTAADGTCTPFTGTLQGHGHTGWNITMNRTAGGAGLFCALGAGAVVENLHIDRSCSFNGTVAGALAASVLGTARVTGVVSDATVVARAHAGGLVGNVSGLAGGTLVVEHCVHRGSVTTLGESARGLVGLVSGNRAATVLFAGCQNTGGGVVQAEHRDGVCWGTRRADQQQLRPEHDHHQLLKQRGCVVFVWTRWRIRRVFQHQRVSPGQHHTLLEQRVCPGSQRARR